MLSYDRLEKHAELLQLIEHYERFLAQQSAGLRASKLDCMPHARTVTPDRIDQILAEKERAVETLRRLRILEEQQRPLVQDTIKATCSSRGRAAVKVELAMTMRYQRGESWTVICDVLHEPNPRKIRSLIISRLERARQKDGIDTETAGGAV